MRTTENRFQNFANRLPAAQLVFGIILGMILAVLMGVLISRGNIRVLLMITGALTGCALIFRFRKNVWLLIPFFSSFTGSLPFLPLPFSVPDMARLTVFGLFIAFIAMKIPLHKLKIDYLDVLLFIFLGYVATVFLRNPVGVNALGSELVGGRPYFTAVIAVMTWFVYQKVRIPPNLAFWFPLLAAGLGIFNGILTVLTWYFPGTVPLIAPFYSGISTQTYMAQEFGGPDEFNRVQPLGSFGSSIGILLTGYFRPITLINPAYLGRFLIFALAIQFIFMSGYRTMLFNVMLAFIISSYLRDGFKEFPKYIVIGLFGLMAIAGIQSSSTQILPFGMQRALSFIPGITWSEHAERATDASDDWRHQMWHDVWHEPQWIENKVLGDGFGFSREDLELMKQADTGGVGYIGVHDPTLHQKITGAYHNGPLTTIRFVGMVGLALFTILLLARAKYAIDLFRDARDTPYYVPCLLAAISAITFPISWFLVFGAFTSDFANIILAIATLRLYRNSLDDYLAAEKNKLATASDA